MEKRREEATRVEQRKKARPLLLHRAGEPRYGAVEASGREICP